MLLGTGFAAGTSKVEKKRGTAVLLLELFDSSGTREGRIKEKTRASWF